MADLTEYVDAAARTLLAVEWPNGPGFDALTPLQQNNYRHAVTPIVAAVAPLIERDARAAALEEAADDYRRQYGHVVVSGRRYAAPWLRGRAQAIREGR